MGTQCPGDSVRSGAHRRDAAGFTLIELAITILIISILTAIAVPSYADYVLRGRLNGATALLKSTRERLEQFYSDNRTYAIASGACAISAFVDTDSQFSFGCVVTNGGQQFTLTATGAGMASAFVYSLDQAGIERTLAVKSGWSSAALPVTRFIVRKE